MSVRILLGDVHAKLREIPDASVNCVVTSPPYWALRDYGTATWQGGDPACDHRSPTMRDGRNEDRAMLAGSAATNGPQLVNGVKAGKCGKCGKCGAIRVDSQLGLEPTPQEHVAAMVAVFDEVRRVLRDDGVCFVNYGDSYAGAMNGRKAAQYKADGSDDRAFRDKPFSNAVGGIKEKDLCLIPERFVLAMQDAGWWVRSRFPWVKRNSMPESITDRAASATEFFFMFAKNGNRRLWWRHLETREWRNVKPPAEYRWRRLDTRELFVAEPPEWQAAKLPDGRRMWARVSMWEGFDYWYDADAVRKAMAPSSIPRLAQGTDHQAGSERAHGGTKVMKAVQRQSFKAVPSGWDAEVDGERHSTIEHAARGQNRGRSTYGRHTLGGNVPEGERRDEGKFGGDTSAEFRRHSSANDGATLNGSRGDRRRGTTPRHSPHTTSCDQSGLDDVARGDRNFRNADLFFESIAGPHGLITDADGLPLGIDVPPQPFRDAHFATFPPKLIEPLIKAGCPKGGTVLDPFGGAGTTGLVADRLGRSAILIELNPEYREIARKRIEKDGGMFTTVAAE